MSVTDWAAVARQAIAALAPDDLRGANLYLDRRVIASGARVAVGRSEVTVDRNSALAFLDRAPQSNWGHPCRYLLIDLATGAANGFDATEPPFLRGASPELRAIARDPAVPDWTLAAPFEPPA